MTAWEALERHTEAGDRQALVGGAPARQESADQAGADGCAGDTALAIVVAKAPA